MRWDLHNCELLQTCHSEHHLSMLFLTSIWVKSSTLDGYVSYLRSTAAAACPSLWSHSRGDSEGGGAWWDVDLAIQWGVC